MSRATEQLLKLPPYGVDVTTKSKVLLAAVHESMSSHYNRCFPFRRWCDKQGFSPEKPVISLNELPFLPVGVFKKMRLMSVEEGGVARVLHSSGTSSQTPSLIVLDKTTRDRQMKVLVRTLSELLGGTRRPFIVFDQAPTAESVRSAALSARIAGMRGYLMAASETTYVLQPKNGRLTLDKKKFVATVEKYKSVGQAFCAIGYTYLAYSSVIRPLLDNSDVIKFPDTAHMIHFGGWKKLQDQSVSPATLNNDAMTTLGLPAERIFDIYGFTEQLGVVYADDVAGVKRVPTYSEVIVRDPLTFEVVPDGKPGLLQFITPLPHSYPGVSLLTDDIGHIVSRDEQGTRFVVHGRVKNAEVRGCGDTLPTTVYRLGD